MQNFFTCIFYGHTLYFYFYFYFILYTSYLYFSSTAIYSIKSLHVLKNYLSLSTQFALCKMPKFYLVSCVEILWKSTENKVKFCYFMQCCKLVEISPQCRIKLKQWTESLLFVLSVGQYQLAHFHLLEQLWKIIGYVGLVLRKFTALGFGFLLSMSWEISPEGYVEG